MSILSGEALNVSHEFENVECQSMLKWVGEFYLKTIHTTQKDGSRVLSVFVISSCNCCERNGLNLNPE